MSESCCSSSSSETSSEVSSACPQDRSAGQPVDWTTVAALSKGRVAPRQEFWLCKSPVCDVVYFGALGDVIRMDEMHVAPAFKSAGSDLVCYCFLHSRGEIEAELAATGSTEVLESIKAEVKAGNCACEVRNPSGKCCLGDVQRAIRELEQPLAEMRP